MRDFFLPFAVALNLRKATWLPHFVAVFRIKRQNRKEFITQIAANRLFFCALHQKVELNSMEHGSLMQIYSSLNVVTL